MEVRFLRYFLAVAQEENISKAAAALHITQPTLSRQLAQVEEELGVKLFLRGPRKLTLTSEGLLLRRRAQEILELVDKTQQDLANQNQLLEGTVAIGCGDLAALEALAPLIQSFRELHPLVRFQLYTATAEHVMERMDRGLTDLGLLLGPVNLEKYQGVAISPQEEWVVAMPPDSPLAQKEAVTPKDLEHLPLILPHRTTSQSELGRWFGPLYQRLQVPFTSNLPSTSLVMVCHGLAYSVIIKGSVTFWDESKLTYRPLSPPLSHTSSLLVWKRQQPFPPGVEHFLRHVKEKALSETSHAF